MILSSQVVMFDKKPKNWYNFAKKGCGNMILTIDIGNTNIVLGGFLEDKLTFISRISTNARKTDAEYATKIKSILALYDVDRNQVSGAIISSVVPPLTKTVKNAVKMVYGVDALVVGPGIKTGINLLADNPTQVGADLICACVAAYNLYQPPVLIVDMGTATKLIYVDEKACFSGVSIIPGVELSLKALAGGTAQLPQISLEAPKSVIGKNTVSNMQAGIVYGYIGQVEYLVKRMKAELGDPNTKVIATGGLAVLVAEESKAIDVLDGLLTLKGLRLIYEKNI